MLGGALIGLGSGAVLLVGQLLLPDAIDYDRDRSGAAREGAYAGVYSTVERVAFAAGLALAGLLLSAIGYVAGSARTGMAQPAEAIRGLYLCAWIVPSVFMLFSVVAVHRACHRPAPRPSSVVP
jgi:GPH family glycoside/pentoside/hexuronide:cation symporter